MKKTIVTILIIFSLSSQAQKLPTKTQLKCDSLGWVMLPETKSYLMDFIALNRSVGTEYAQLYVQQHSGYSWSITIWRTKYIYYVTITTKPFTPPDEKIIENN